MNAIICGTGGRTPPQRNMRSPVGLNQWRHHWLTLLQDLVGLAQFPDLALQFLDPILLGTCQPGPLPAIRFGLLAPYT
jgi:hypothetical protein